MGDVKLMDCKQKICFPVYAISEAVKGIIYLRKVSTVIQQYFIFENYHVIVQFLEYLKV